MIDERSIPDGSIVFVIDILCVTVFVFKFERSRRFLDRDTIIAVVMPTRLRPWIKPPRGDLCFLILRS
jgi:hypothetical protein